jgi:hypothetical protein
MDKMDGKKVKSISWHVPSYGDIQSRTVKEGEFAYLSYEYHGDHAENWIIFEDRHKEIMRFNTAKLSSIEWEDE